MQKISSIVPASLNQVKQAENKSIQRHVRIPFSLAQNPNVSPAAKATYLALAFFFPKIFPSIAKIQTMTGLSRITVIRSLKELVEHKLIVITKTAGFSNQYRIKSNQE